jgi:U6 snRNA-associated Sm-like protein LSm8
MLKGVEQLVNQKVSVITVDGRSVVGVLKSVDESMNLLLGDSYEYISREDIGVVEIPLNLHILRGDNV